MHLQSVRIMGASSWQELRFVVLPSAAAWVLTGLKVSVPYALIGAVVGEMISSNRGIGFLIGQASGLFDTAGVFAGLLTLFISLPTASKLGRLDPSGKAGPYFDELRSRQKLVSTVSGVLALLALVAGIMVAHGG